jgi:coatomer subunit beta'
MNLAFNPKDTNTFLSACLDRTVKMWSLGSSTPNFSMEAHEKGVNYVDFYLGADIPYLVTTGDDKTIKVWGYLCKQWKVIPTTFPLSSSIPIYLSSSVK